ncbi:MAG TPA: AraC family transcriptional regulator [Candidatus Eisenbergiella merdavium]|uniref:AraC family transcriptional regulator n=1 Tax=Candidatus Eisenbergiella merdavium TaxID=2838551 RepID=A0A9D2SMX1_9FIRM|nr:AraC family transcriptional regulator [Candidatus Eisenbergiella merdavium]
MPITRYPLNNDENNSISARLLYVTYSKFENDWPSLVHTHYFTELCYIKGGQGIYLIEDSRYPVRRDDFIIINANVAHTEMSDGDSPLEYIILGVEGISFTFGGGSRDHIIFNCGKDHADFLFYMNALLEEMENKSRDYELVCQNLLEVLIVKLLRRSNLSFEYETSVKSSRECLKLKQYIEANYTQDITLDTLAEISHLNKFYLVHAFTRYFGCSPMNYLCEVRIKASKELLASTDYSITEVAQSSGFSSQSYFAQCFRKYCRMTASAYRKSCRAEGKEPPAGGEDA